MCDLCNGVFLHLPVVGGLYDQEIQVVFNCSAVLDAVERRGRNIQGELRWNEDVPWEKELRQRMQCPECQQEEKQKEHAKKTPQIDHWRKRIRKLPKRKPK